MRFVPDYQLNIIAESDFVQGIRDVEQKLIDRMVEGSFQAFDNTEIHYEYILAQDSKASIVIVHGLSEFTKKFYEFIYYALNQGYNVFIYDQRCHGLSGRLTDQLDLLHVDDFRDYVKDLSQFIDEVVVPTEDKPIYLYSHSMGGAISALYLSGCSDRVKKAVLAAPMFLPVVQQVPTWLARHSVRVGRLFFGTKRKFFLTSEFDPDIPYRERYGSSKARFEHNMKMRKENPQYQSTPMTFGWIYNALIVGSRIFKRKVIDNIHTKILLISAENDMTVRNEPQHRFAQKCKTCEFKEIKGASHALLESDEKMMSEILQLTFDFYAEHQGMSVDS